MPKDPSLKKQAVLAAYRRNPSRQYKVIAMETGVSEGYVSAVVGLEKLAKYGAALREGKSREDAAKECNLVMVHASTGRAKKDAVIRVLKENPGMKPADIAKLAGVSRPLVYWVLRGLNMAEPRKAASYGGSSGYSGQQRLTTGKI